MFEIGDIVSLTESGQDVFGTVVWKEPKYKEQTVPASPPASHAVLTDDDDDDDDDENDENEADKEVVEEESRTVLAQVVVSYDYVVALNRELPSAKPSAWWKREPSPHGDNNLPTGMGMKVAVTISECGLRLPSARSLGETLPGLLITSFCNTTVMYPTGHSRAFFSKRWSFRSAGSSFFRLLSPSDNVADYPAVGCAATGQLPAVALGPDRMTELRDFKPRLDPWRALAWDAKLQPFMFTPAVNPKLQVGSILVAAPFSRAQTAAGRPLRAQVSRNRAFCAECAALIIGVDDGVWRAIALDVGVSPSGGPSALSYFCELSLDALPHPIEKSLADANSSPVAPYFPEFSKAVLPLAGVKSLLHCPIGTEGPVTGVIGRHVGLILGGPEFSTSILHPYNVLGGAPIVPGVNLNGDIAHIATELAAAVNSDAKSSSNLLDVLLVRGHMQWKAGTLEGEIANDLWTVLPVASQGHVFARDRNSIWPRVYREIGEELPASGRMVFPEF